MWAACTVVCGFAHRTATKARESMTTLIRACPTIRATIAFTIVPVAGRAATTLVAAAIPTITTTEVGIDPLVAGITLVAVASVAAIRRRTAIVATGAIATGVATGAIAAAAKVGIARVVGVMVLPYC